MKYRSHLQYHQQGNMEMRHYHIGRLIQYIRMTINSTTYRALYIMGRQIL